MKLWRILGILSVALCVNATACFKEEKTRASAHSDNVLQLAQDRTKGPYTDFAGGHTVEDVCSSRNLPTYSVLTANVKYRSQTPTFCLPSSNFLFGTIIYTPGFHYR